MPASERTPLILAIDGGTQSVRAGLIDRDGTLHGFVKTPIEPYLADAPGRAEIDANHYYEVLGATCRQLFSQPGCRKEDIAAVTLATQRLTFVNVDKDGKPLRPAIVWLDQRRADPRKVIPFFLVPVLKACKLYDILDFAIGYSRSNWIRQNQPDVWEKTHKFLVLSGYLTHRLTGEFRDSAGNLMGTIPIDVKTGDWCKWWDFKSFIFPIEPEKLPEAVPQTGLLGAITAQAEEETGIPQGLPMFAASNDKACEVIGAGCLTPSTACISFGTMATINTQISRYVEIRPLMPPFPSAIPGEFYTEVNVMRGFWMISWFKQEFGLQESLAAAEKGEQVEALFERLLQEVPPGSMGLVLQPYWTPGPDLASYAKGSIIGFGDVHTRAHLYRAIIEGIVFALKEGAELTAQKNKTPITELRASGGGSRSDSVMQITSDVFGLPVHRPHTNETSALGAAMDAAVGLKWYGTVQEAVAGMAHVGRTFSPNPQNQKVYAELYERVYKKIYQKLLPLFAEIQEITGYPEPVGEGPGKSS